MKTSYQQSKTVPLNIVGSSVFGRYPKISAEQTYNMIISDGWLVNYAGHKQVLTIEDVGKGRGIFNSTRYNHMIVVIDNAVYTVDNELFFEKIAEIDTSNGDVFIDENDVGQIAICDKKDIWIYNYSSSSFNKATIDFVPNYIAFQNGRFIAADANKPQWRLSAIGDGLVWNTSDTGLFQTKPDNVTACVRFPGRGNQLLVMGKTVTESWVDVGYQLFPYQRNSSFNIDYGCANPATIAASDTFVVWLGVNEKSGAAIMYTSGGDIEQISSDGINFKLEQLNDPTNAYGFLFKQDGHLFYQLTFADPRDDFTLVYDFNTKAFFSLCDELMGAHIAKRIAYFNGTYYFISFDDGNLYEMSTQYTTYNGKEIPRVRVCKSYRMQDSSPFIVNNLTFTIEQGNDSDIQRVDLSISRDGGVSFGNILGKELNPLAYRKNRLIYYQLGYANDFTPQFRFWGKGRFVATDGTMSVYQ